MTFRENTAFMNNLRKTGIRQQLTLDRLAMELDRALVNLRAADAAPMAGAVFAARQISPVPHL